MERWQTHIFCWYQLQDGSLKDYKTVFCEKCPNYNKEYKFQIVATWVISKDQFEIAIKYDNRTE